VPKPPAKMIPPVPLKGRLRFELSLFSFSVIELDVQKNKLFVMVGFVRETWFMLNKLRVVESATQQKLNYSKTASYITGSFIIKN
jgi:hypothetical protein